MHKIVKFKIPDSAVKEMSSVRFASQRFMKKHAESIDKHLLSLIDPNTFDLKIMHKPLVGQEISKVNKFVSKSIYRNGFIGNLSGFETYKPNEPLFTSRNLGDELCRRDRLLAVLMPNLSSESHYSKYEFLYLIVAAFVTIAVAVSLYI